MARTFNNIARAVTFWCALAGSWDRLPPEPAMPKGMTPGFAQRPDHTFDQAWSRRVARYCKTEAAIARCSEDVPLNQILHPVERKAWLRVDKQQGLLPGRDPNRVRIWIRENARPVRAGG